jgi:hypothetical protein
MKRVTDDLDDPKLAYLKKLEEIARMLGSSVTAVYSTPNISRIPLHVWAVQETLRRFKLDTMEVILDVRRAPEGGYSHDDYPAGIYI